MGSVRVAIVGVGNCASSLVQGVEYYRNADPNDRVPGLMHVKFGDYHVSRRGVRRRLRRRRQEGRQGPRRGDRRQREQHHQALRRAADRRAPSSAARPSTVWASTTARSVEESDEPSRSTWSQALRDAQVDVVVSYLPVGSERGRQVLRPGRDRRRLRLRQRAAGLHRLRPGVGAEVHRRRPADRRRRHQVPGRRDHRAPRAGQAVRGPRRRAAAHVPAQLRRQHGLHEHAGAHAAWSRRRSPRPSR